MTVQTMDNFNLELGRPPRVVGTVSTTTTLQDLLHRARSACDIIEVRLDKIGVEASWLEKCKILRDAAIPVLATIRLASQGGNWQNEDNRRKPYFNNALSHLSAIDIEADSSISTEMCETAAAKNKPVILSYHNFSETPGHHKLRQFVQKVDEAPGFTIPKVATMINSEKDIDNLHRLIRERDGAPICALGMGPRGMKTRIIFPCLGSWLTYGHLDHSTAPGQLRSDFLVDTLSTLLPCYNRTFSKHNESC